MAPSRVRGYLRGMKRWIEAILCLAPGGFLIAAGVSEIASSNAPWLAAQFGYSPVWPAWVSVAVIVFGALGASPYLFVLRLGQRLRTSAL
jgi:hypothetical protein